MKRRLDSTTSERELVLALAQRGRATSLAALSSWRKDGLLPPFASQGVGTGRSYYWREENILSRACTVFDFLEKHQRVDTALWMLWLCGFPVSLGPLRRYWLHRCRTREPWTPRRPRVTRLDASPNGITSTSSALLFTTACMLGGTFPSDDRCAAVIVRAVARFTRTNCETGDIDAGHLWSLLQMMGVALEASTLLSTASDAEINESQGFLGLVAAEFEDCAGESGAWGNWLAERVGAQIFMLILALLKSGQREVLEAIALKLERLGRRNAPTQARQQYA